MEVKPYPLASRVFSTDNTMEVKNQEYLHRALQFFLYFFHFWGVVTSCMFLSVHMCYTVVRLGQILILCVLLIVFLVSMELYFQFK